VVHTILNRRPSRSKVTTQSLVLPGMDAFEFVGHEKDACVWKGDYDVLSLGSRPIQLSANEREKGFARPKALCKVQTTGRMYARVSGACARAMGRVKRGGSARQSTAVSLPLKKRCVSMNEGFTRAQLHPQDRSTI
jgi:hypothetical protein